MLNELELNNQNKNAILYARNYAIVAHGNQKYGEHPYLYHLDRVAEIAGHIYYHRFYNRKTTDAEIGVIGFLQGAYLHDVVEDTIVSIEQIEFDFGSQVRWLVANLTHNKHENYDQYLMDIKRKVTPRYLKLADAMANLEASIGINDYRLITKYHNVIGVLTDLS